MQQTLRRGRAAEEFDGYRDLMRSLWMLGVLRRGRFAFWRLFWATLIARPRKFRAAMELAILGHHFRTVAERL